MSPRFAVTLLVLSLGPQVAAEGVFAQDASRQKALASLAELSGSFEALSEHVAPAVVQIHATGYAPLPDAQAAGAGLIAQRRVGGSGVILDPAGFIVTNAHVIEGARRVQVRLPDPADTAAPRASILGARGRVVDARVVGIDRETDLAVLQVPETGLPYLSLGDSDGLRQGQLVFAFGSPLGLENSVTMGVVSSVARQLRPEDPMIYIQTDAPINPGSSGGALVDARGRVVGINTFIITQSGGNEGIGFAAPSNIVQTVFRQIRTIGWVRRGEIGVHAQTITPTLAAGLGLDRDWGVILGDVYPGGPADRTGLAVGDVVLAVDGKPMENGRQLDVNIYQRAIGDPVKLEVLRDGQHRSFDVPVIERPGDFDHRLFETVSPEENLIESLGVLAIEVDRRTAAMLPALRRAEGVVVVAHSATTHPGATGLQPGDVIHSVNGRLVNDVTTLRSALEGIGTAQAVVLHVERRGRLMYLAFEQG